LSLVQADLLRGKSIGFLPTKVHHPKQKVLDERSWQNAVDLAIEEWLLLEYACTFLPAQQNAVAEAVSKSQVQIPDEFLKAMEFNPDFFAGQVWERRVQTILSPSRASRRYNGP
jgi:hypothetical protein